MRLERLRSCFCYARTSLVRSVVNLFSPLGKLADRAMLYFIFRNFSFFNRSPIISGSTGPIFTIFSPYKMYLRELYRSGPLF